MYFAWQWSKQVNRQLEDYSNNRPHLQVRIVQVTWLTFNCYYQINIPANKNMKMPHGVTVDNVD
jgi:hypothetical protein